MLPAEMPAGKSHKGAPAADPAIGGDRIGALPEEILHRILSFLPAQQAVRTCVLARRWIHLWKYATGLRIVGADGNAPVPFEEVPEFVDSLLRLRGSSPLETFDVRVAGAAVDVRHLTLWVRYGMICNVQVLRLEVHGNAPALLRFEDPPLASRHLTKLELRGLAFNKDFLDFSRCPAIQDLIIKECSFVHAERILSQSLKHINIVRGIFNNLSSRTPIHTPNLASLKLHVSGGRTPILDRMPLLVSADVLINSCDSCSRSDNGDCGDESCTGCIPNDTSSVLLHGISEAEKLLLASGTKTGCKINVEMSGRFNPGELPSTISPHLKRVKVCCGTVDKTVLEVLEFLSRFNINFSFKTVTCTAEAKSCAT